MNRSDENAVYEFGGFELDVAGRRLLSPDGQPLELSSRVFDTLLCLVENRGQLIDKVTLMQTVWPNTVVEENNLNQAIASLRKSLGDSPREHRFIATDPGRGYRFVAEVKIRDEDRPARPTSGAAAVLSGKMWALVIVAVLAIAWFVAQEYRSTDEPSRLASGATERSIAVLPFVDLSPGGDQEYFSDGIAEELLNQLSKLRGLHVAGRTSSFSFKGKADDLRVIGDKLNVANILEGSVRKAEGRVRITITLVKVADGFELWSETYDRDLTDIFAIQEETAQSVANALSITLGVGDSDLGVGGTRNFDAYDAYLTGMSFLWQTDLESVLQAIDYLEEAVALDPEYVDAWSTLARVYENSASLYVAGRTDELFRKSEAAARRAIEIAPEAVGSLLAAAQLHERNHDWAQTELELRKAKGLAPTHYWTNIRLGQFYLNVGQPNMAIRYLRVAASTEPLLQYPIANIMLGLGYLGEFDAALGEYEQSEGLIGDRARLLTVPATLALEMGDRELIEEYLDQLIAVDPLPPANWPLTTTMRKLLDSPESALAELRRFYTDPAYRFPLVRSAMAVWASYFGDDELALDILRDLYEANEFVVHGLWRHMHRKMRKLPEFKALVRDLGLVDYWRATGNWGEFCRPLGADDFECK